MCSSSQLPWEITRIQSGRSKVVGNDSHHMHARMGCIEDRGAHGVVDSVFRSPQMRGYGQDQVE